ncbi:hypothetical protein N7478_010814 [Penicillium angulare]|uniref:uncharacterized protein n=1 Tax=Penicillium angulare TaxID=116970 RepID=UPI00253F7500|nr:uncharacterized protein N7478_010814 [Penicillium angulare]KAJ5263209.1 hypothetical protein N7478_010814 [Penicillium angulare]
MASPTPTPQIPSTMRAWVRARRGPADRALELSIIPTPPIPTSSSSDVLIRVSHVSLQVNTEFLLNIQPRIPFTNPGIPELELSGEIVAAGDGVSSDLREIGAHVVAFQNIPNAIMGYGVMAEYILLPASQVARIDAGVDMAAASGINGCGSTARKIIRTAGVQSGHTVLVNGASGSVGSVLVQLCKLRGVKVVGVASGGNEELVRALDVDEFIDYRKHDLPVYLAKEYGDKPFDFVLDCVGSQALYANSPKYLKSEGAVVNIGALEGMVSLTCNIMWNKFLPVWLGGVPRPYIFFSTPPTRDDAVFIGRLVEEGKLRIPVDSVFDMEDVIGAYERIATKRARGKVVVKIRRD